MHRAFNFLLLVALLVSALHMGEDAHAHESAELHHLEHAHLADPNDDPGDSHDGTGKVAHSGHHHCPIAAENHGPTLSAPLAGAALHCVRPVAALVSLSRAPPLEPPSA
ncbi:MAG: hypothetical protein B7Z08_03180 [Sphingomonadales bacterium 32-68-7]|nr:MAG: hypothetical protein B7Z33_07850 [Sphingomonadales bacterium 12-68-11]OYX09939.1 MAG: hypothetical protein B7Z08_03180 [Sphingomonadales bacterium 32-68-7]